MRHNSFLLMRLAQMHRMAKRAKQKRQTAESEGFRQFRCQQATHDLACLRYDIKDLASAGSKS